MTKQGYSQRLRHVSRTHKCDLGSIREVLDRDSVKIWYIASAEQAVDIFTKAVIPQNWEHAFDLLNIVDDAEGKGASSSPAGHNKSVMPNPPAVPSAGDTAPAKDDRPSDSDLSQLGESLLKIRQGCGAVADM